MDYVILRSHVLGKLREAGIIVGDKKGRLLDSEKTFLETLTYKLLDNHPHEDDPFYNFSQHVRDISIREYGSDEEEYLEKARQKIRKNINVLLGYKKAVPSSAPSSTTAPPPPKSWSKKSTPHIKYTQESILEAIRGDLQETGKPSVNLTHNIKHGPLAAKGVRLAAANDNMSRGMVPGIPEGTSISVLMHENGLGNKEEFKGKPAPLSAVSIFNSVAWYIKKTKKEPEATQEIIETGMLHHLKTTWKAVSNEMKNGTVQGVPINTDFSAYTKLVHERLKQKNFKAPGWNELTPLAINPELTAPLI